MPIPIKMPALSPTMEEGTLVKWLVKAGDQVKPGDLLAEVETDKATMEVEAVDEGTVTSIAVAEGTDGVKVGTIIAMLGESGQASPTSTPTSPPTQPLAPDTPPAGMAARAPAEPAEPQVEDRGLPSDSGTAPPAPARPTRAAVDLGRASPLAGRLALAQGIDLAALSGSGPNGRIMKADLPGGGASPGPIPATLEATTPAPTAAARPVAVPDIPHEATKLSNVRRTIARRLTESKQTVPHIYLTVDVELGELLNLRGELNASLATRGVKLSVNDLLIKALAAALIQAPKCNVMFTPDQLISFTRADISVAVSTPSGLITPVIAGADGKSLSRISTEMKQLAGLARDGRLKPEQYQGGTASISNMGMFGIRQFDAVINPPQGMILAVGAGEKRPWATADGSLGVASVMSATGSFDHRAIDGADAAEMMQAFKGLVEKPLWLLA